MERVSKNFGGIKAVDNASISVAEGGLHCLIGPNGAGKTTIFKLIMGIYPVTIGKVLFYGESLNNVPMYKRVRKGISIKMQIPGVYHDLTLRDNIRIAIQNYVKRERVENEIDRLIKLVGIENLGNPLVRNIPHGQQQWLEIAMSLGSRPKLLLLDEPAAGMGPDEMEFTAKIIKRINGEGTTIIFIDHDMDFVAQISQRVTVLHYGKVFAEGTFDDIRSNEDVIKIYLGKV
jgi:branched-chain amino acid transport system ATP-binding protein